MNEPAPAPKIPLRLIRHQGPMLASLGRIALGAAVPLGRPRTNPASIPDEHEVIAAPSDELVDRYAAWSGVPDRYPLTLPPHMIAQWSIPLATRVLRRTRYDIATIINQGVTLRVHGELPRDVPLHLAAHLTRLDETDGRARASISLTTGTAADPGIVDAELHVMFPLRGGSPRRRTPSSPSEEAGDWTAIGDWQASKDDGLRFAILTGDFNPIHWIGLAGRLSPFKTTVLQGFGMLARTFEILNRTDRVGVLDVRFLKPVTLPSPPVTVQVRSSSAGSHVRLVGPDSRVHLAGTYDRALP